MSHTQNTPTFLSLCLVVGLLGVFAIKLSTTSENSLTRENAFAKESSSLTKIANEFEISPRILVSVLWSRQEVDSWTFGQRITNLFRESGRKHSERIYSVDFQTAEWVEEQISNHHGPYFLTDDKASLIGKSESQRDLVEKLKSTETNIRYNCAYMAMVIRAWREDSMDISQSIDTLATLFSLGANASLREIVVNEYGNRAKAFHESDRLLGYFPLVNIDHTNPAATKLEHL